MVSLTSVRVAKKQQTGRRRWRPEERSEMRRGYMYIYSTPECSEWYLDSGSCIFVVFHISLT